MQHCQCGTPHLAPAAAVGPAALRVSSLPTGAAQAALCLLPVAQAQTCGDAEMAAKGEGAGQPSSALTQPSIAALQTVQSCLPRSLVGRGGHVWHDRHSRRGRGRGRSCWRLWHRGSRYNNDGRRGRGERERGRRERRLGRWSRRLGRARLDAGWGRGRTAGGSAGRQLLSGVSGLGSERHLKLNRALLSGIAAAYCGGGEGGEGGGGGLGGGLGGGGGLRAVRGTAVGYREAHWWEQVAISDWVRPAVPPLQGTHHGILPRRRRGAWWRAGRGRRAWRRAVAWDVELRCLDDIHSDSHCGAACSGPPRGSKPTHSLALAAEAAEEGRAGGGAAEAAAAAWEAAAAACTQWRQHAPLG